MFLKKRIIRINDIVQIATKLTADLNADGRLGGQNRNQIFEQSKIRELSGQYYSGNNRQLNSFSLKYKVQEESPMIIGIFSSDGEGTIHGRGTKCKRILLMDKIVELTKITVNAYVCPITKKKIQFAEDLNVGDRFLLNGLVSVSFTHGYESKTTHQWYRMENILPMPENRTDELYCSRCDISIFL